MAITKELIQELRAKTGCGMLDCKKALEENGGDIEKAVAFLRKKGIAIAAKRGGNKTSEGVVHAYIHPGSQVGVLVEINCETDFVARTEQIAHFAQDICMHIAAMKPRYVKIEDVDPAFIAHEREIVQAQLNQPNKPQNIIDQIVEGKLKKVYSEVCLLEQPFIKNDGITIGNLLQELIAKTGENVVIKRFARYEVGAD